MFDENLCFFRAELSIAGHTVETCPAVEMDLRLAAVRARNGLVLPIEHFLSGLLLTVKCFSTEPDVLSAILERVLSADRAQKNPLLICGGRGEGRDKQGLNQKGHLYPTTK